MSKARNLVDRIMEGLLTGSDVRIGLFDSTGNCVYSTLNQEVEDITKDVIPRSFPFWDSGDYQVKNLNNGCLLISRVSDKLALAIDSKERVEMVIASLGILLRKFKEDFEGIDGSSLDEIGPSSITSEIPVSQPLEVSSPESVSMPEKPISPVPEPAPIPQVEEETKKEPKKDKRGKKKKKEKRKKKKRVEHKREMPRRALWFPTTR
ncbi:MAG: hypothetical protein ACFE7E_06385 [Candidatus Hodarchaeota archaeon]